MKSGSRVWHRHRVRLSWKKIKCSQLYTSKTSWTCQGVTRKRHQRYIWQYLCGTLGEEIELSCVMVEGQGLCSRPLIIAHHHHLATIRKTHACIVSVLSRLAQQSCLAPWKVTFICHPLIHKSFAEIWVKISCMLCLFWSRVRQQHENVRRPYSLAEQGVDDQPQARESASRKAWTVFIVGVYPSFIANCLSNVIMSPLCWCCYSRTCFFEMRISFFLF